MPGSSLPLRFAAPAITTVVFAALYVLHGLGDDALYRSILLGWGVVPFEFPFLDTHYALSSLQCWHHGVDVYLTNPCDALGRTYAYSPALLWAQVFALGTSDTQIAGLIVDGLFLLSLFALPPPRDAAHAVLMLFATLSTMTAFALERANLDVLIFVLVVLAGVLLQRGLVPRLAAFAVISIAALMKFYPAVLLIAALRERPRLFVAVSAAVAGALIVLAALDHAELAMAFGNLPKRLYFQSMFGAANLPYGLAELSPGRAPLPLLVAAVGITFSFAIWLASRSALDRAWASLDNGEATFMLLGCALIVGCFFAGGSYGYRGIFLIFTLPGLLGLIRSADAAPLRRFWSVVLLLVIFLMWGEFFRLAMLRSGASPSANFVFWLGRELIWWWVIGVLGALVIRFAAESETTRACARRLFPKLHFGSIE